MALVYATVASQAANGPLVQTLTESQVATLATDYQFHYAQFLATARSLINQDVQAVERNEPEGQRNLLTINGWNGQAAQAAQAITQQWQQGNVIGSNGQPLQAWPEYTGQIAWATNNGNTLELRWVKEEWQLYLVIFVLIAVVGYLVYRILTQSSWSLQTASQPSSGSVPGIIGSPTNGSVPFIGGKPFRVFWLPWYWDVGIAAAVIAGPYIYRQVVSVEETRVKSVEAQHEYRHVREEG